MEIRLLKFPILAEPARSVFERSASLVFTTLGRRCRGGLGLGRGFFDSTTATAAAAIATAAAMLTTAAAIPAVATVAAIATMLVTAATLTAAAALATAAAILVTTATIPTMTATTVAVTRRHAVATMTTMTTMACDCLALSTHQGDSDHREENRDAQSQCTIHPRILLKQVPR